VEPIRYQNGELVKVGDQVCIRRVFRRRIVGTVTYVYDPSIPLSVPSGSNEYGFSVKVSNEREIWFGGTRNIELIKRG